MSLGIAIQAWCRPRTHTRTSQSIVHHRGVRCVQRLNTFKSEPPNPKQDNPLQLSHWKLRTKGTQFQGPLADKSSCPKPTVSLGPEDFPSCCSTWHSRFPTLSSVFNLQPSRQAPWSCFWSRKTQSKRQPDLFKRPSVCVCVRACVCVCVCRGVCLHRHVREKKKKKRVDMS